MIYQERRFVMKNGETAVIRSPYPSEAGKMLEYIRMMSAETEFVGRYPEEIRETLEEETDFLKRCCDSADSVQISAFVNGRLAGNASVEPVSNRKKMHHRADFGIAILKEFWGLGLGGELTFACLDMAEQMGYEQIELGMLEDNEKGYRLYRKAGFQTWGKLENGFKLKGGSRQAEIFMVKKLGAEDKA